MFLSEKRKLYPGCLTAFTLLTFSLAIFDSTSESRATRAERLEQQAKSERHRIEEIKRRYSNTPLRRIITHQISDASSRLQKSTPSPVDSVISDSDEILRYSIADVCEERTENWAQNIYDGLEFSSRICFVAKKSNTPLRRILDRQLSASI